jgi:16S rRNA (uracil1498-N3)-methyltransferase
VENLFYAEPSSFEGESQVIIEGQEAQHISRVLRNKVGDQINVADGAGNHFTCEITGITKKNVTAQVKEKEEEPRPEKEKILALGIIKKRDRLEFAVEKAVELGATQIILFNSDHSERSKLNEERTRLLVISAFKQSGRYWLPELHIRSSLEEVLESFSDAHLIMAHEEIPVDQKPESLHSAQNLLLVGPEGGFSQREVELVSSKGAELISLGKNRLRAETAVTAILSQYLFE